MRWVGMVGFRWHGVGSRSFVCGGRVWGGQATGGAAHLHPPSQRAMPCGIHRTHSHSHTQTARADAPFLVVVLKVLHVHLVLVRNHLLLSGRGSVEMRGASLSHFDGVWSIPASIHPDLSVHQMTAPPSRHHAGARITAQHCTDLAAGEAAHGDNHDGCVDAMQ